MLNSNLASELTRLNKLHCAKHKQFQDIVSNYFVDTESPADIFIHTNLFKKNIFVPDTNSADTVYHSSGTSGQPSKIFFNREESLYQQRNLIKSVTPFLEISRRSLFIEISYNKTDYNNARKAASGGFSLLCKKRIKIDATNISDALSLIDSNLSNYDSVVFFGFSLGRC